LLPLAFPEWARFAEWKNLKDTKKTKNKTKTRMVLFTSWFPHLKSLITWLLAQVLWLGFAYLLEFCGKAVFFELWIASVTFLGANAWLLVDVIKRRRVSAEAVADQII
jgi:membrane protein YqaA with SNARE-associated domain